jgi:hypothetical protein
MKYTLTVEAHEPENNMTIQCSDKEDLAHYASEVIKQGYKTVTAKIEEE